MRVPLRKIVKTVLMLAGAALLTFFGVRVYDSQRGLPLEPWHIYTPREMTADELDRADWRDYLETEQQIFQSVQANVTDKLPPQDQVPYNRYYANSPVNPTHFAQDWNRSYALAPGKEPTGAVVLLHGLTDSPYSLRHLATRYRDRGFYVVAIRAPAHGTVPAALVSTDWETWLAATRLAVREARRLAPHPLPLHIVGFSNGGSLALKYAFDAIENTELARPDRLILVSPMVGITRFARFAGTRRSAGLPARLRKSRVAQRSSRVQSFQIQFISCERRAPVLSPDRGAADADRPPRARRAADDLGADPDLSVGHGFHG